MKEESRAVFKTVRKWLEKVATGIKQGISKPMLYRDFIRISPI